MTKKSSSQTLKEATQTAKAVLATASENTFDSCLYCYKGKDKPEGHGLYRCPVHAPLTTHRKLMILKAILGALADGTRENRE